MISFEPLTARLNSASVIRVDSSDAIFVNLSISVSIADFVFGRAVAMDGPSFFVTLLTQFTPIG
jgi:hypothetical protein